MHPVSCTNTHHDVPGLINHGIAKNTETKIKIKIKNILRMEHNFSTK